MNSEHDLCEAYRKDPDSDAKGCPCEGACPCHSKKDVEERRAYQRAIMDPFSGVQYPQYGD